MSVYFGDGPLQGQVGGEPAPEEELSEGDRFKRLLSDIRALLQSNDLSEQNTLLVSKAESMLQQVKASEEREEEQAMSGKLSPGILRKIGNAGGGSY